MKTKTGFHLRSVLGEHIIVAEGVENIDFSKIISMNETAAALWKNFEGKTFTQDDMVSFLLDEYEVDEATARNDIQAIVDQWTDAGIIE